MFERIGNGVHRMVAAGLIAAATWLPLAGAAAAQEIIAGAGATQFHDETGKDSALIALEYRARPFGRLLGGQAALATAADVDMEGDLWVGIGIAVRWSLGDGPWFTEAGFMPGYSHAGRSANDLGGPIAFRSHLAVGRQIGTHTAISLAAVHKSNAEIYDENPGVNALLLRVHWQF